MYQVLFYEDKRGKCPTEVFLDKMPTKIIAKIDAWIEKLEEHGPNLLRPYADKVRGKIRELRVIFGTNHYRFFYFFLDKNIIITHGILKKTNAIPEKEIKKAENIMNDFLERYKGGEIKL